jgi:geranylgeranyl pyrophosphate synthase
MAGANVQCVEAMGQFALNLGIAFQIVDDILDVVGHKELLGKPTGMDLRDGNPSIPIILALKEGQQAVLDAFQTSPADEATIEEALQAIIRGPAIREATILSNTYANQALKTIRMFPPSRHRDGLKTLIHLITDRES